MRDFDTFDHVLLPGDGDFDIIFTKNVKIPTLCPTLPIPLGLGIDSCIIYLKINAFKNDYKWEYAELIQV